MQQAAGKTETWARFHGGFGHRLFKVQINF
jgi:hypothetical protein